MEAFAQYYSIAGPHLPTVDGTYHSVSQLQLQLHFHAGPMLDSVAMGPKAVKHRRQPVKQKDGPKLLFKQLPTRKLASRQMIEESSHQLLILRTRKQDQPGELQRATISTRAQCKFSDTAAML